MPVEFIAFLRKHTAVKNVQGSSFGSNNEFHVNDVLGNIIHGEHTVLFFSLVLEQKYFIIHARIFVENRVW